ncbi:MAG: transporter substrate-binding domain-containing protein [Longicatena sp.]
MKKVVALAFACSLLLVGCGSGSKANKDTNTGKEKLTVGMECGYAPYNWQTKNQTDSSVSIGGAGYCDGYDVMMARKLADSLGREVVVKKIAWDGLTTAVDKGEIDVIIAGMTKNAEREKGTDFTSPYFDAEAVVMIVRKDSPEAKLTNIKDFAGKKVMGQKNTNYDDVINQIKDVDHMTPKSTYPQLILALQSKETDAITAELPVAEGLVKANNDLMMIRFDKDKGFDYDTTVSIGMKKGSKDSQLYKDIESALAKIKQEERKEMMLKAIDSQPKVGE